MGVALDIMKDLTVLFITITMDTKRAKNFLA